MTVFVFCIIIIINNNNTNNANKNRGHEPYPGNLLRAVGAEELLEQCLEEVSVLPQEAARQLDMIARVIACQTEQRLSIETDRVSVVRHTTPGHMGGWYLEAGVEEKRGKEQARPVLLERWVGQVAQEERLVAGVLLAKERGPRGRLQQREDQLDPVLSTRRENKPRVTSDLAYVTSSSSCASVISSPERARSGSERARGFAQRCRG